LGAGDNRGPYGGYDFPYELARSLCLIGAAAANAAPIETIHADFRDEVGLKARVAYARRQGFRGMLAIHPAQVDVIHKGFTPSAEEIAAAREIVDLFAANPSVGVFTHQGAMLDAPHLARAQAILAMAKASRRR
jgi:citrate lyase subunit beta/citryl-CoA lyase